MAIDDDMREAAEARFNALVELFRRRRESASRFYEEKQPRRDAGLRLRHHNKIARARKQDEGMQPPDTSFLTDVRTFDHTILAKHPAYPQLRQALSDLANQVAEAEGMALGDFLDSVRDMALTAPYGNICHPCTRHCAAEHRNPNREGLCPCGAYAIHWPHAAERRNNSIRGTYTCSKGHTWTCGYAVDVMRYL